MSILGKWKLNEAAGSNRLDSSGNGYTLAESGGNVNQGTGHGGGANLAASFPGTSFLIKANDSNILGTNKLSISARINLDSINVNQSIVGRWNFGIGYSFDFRVGANNKLAFYVSSDGESYVGAVSSTTLTTGTWYHVVAVYNGTNVKVFIDKVQNGTTPSFSLNLYNLAQGFCIGASDQGGALKFNGRIDDVVVANHDFTQTEIDDYFNLGDDFAVPANPINKIINETQQVTEAMFASLGLRRLINETVQASEGVLKFLGYSLKKTVDETLQISEGVIKNLVTKVVKLVSETVQTTEGIVRHLVLAPIIKVISETIQATESLLRSMALSRVVGETQQLAEAVSRSMGLKRLLNETVQVVEAAQWAKPLIKVINEAVELAEYVVRVYDGLVTIIARASKRIFIHDSKNRDFGV